MLRDDYQYHKWSRVDSQRHTPFPSSYSIRNWHFASMRPLTKKSYQKWFCKRTMPIIPAKHYRFEKDAKKCEREVFYDVAVYARKVSFCEPCLNPLSRPIFYLVRCKASRVPCRVGKGMGCLEWGINMVRSVGTSGTRNSRKSASKPTRFTTVFAMACIGSSRLCARAEKLCQFGHFAQIRRKVTTTTCAKSRAEIERPVDTLMQHSQTKTSARECRMGGVARAMSSMQTQLPGPLPDYQVDPYRLLEEDLKDLYDDIRQLLTRNTMQEELRTISMYYFDAQGKALRPMLAILMARAINYHKERNDLLNSQRQVAIICEMIHNASLIHDDVIDQSNYRRGRPSANVLWSQKKVTIAGDYILSVLSMMIARLRNDDVTILLAQVVTDLVQGEFMQLGSKETENERFTHYLTKTYRKTASLIANSLKSVAVLAKADEPLTELAYQYGRNVGLAFQLIDDLLDFISSVEAMGKPTAADLKLGLATAPVLFACDRYPELNAMIMRRFKEPGDVEKAFELVHKSHGLEQTRFLAKKHCVEAVKLAQSLAESPYQKGLIVVCDLILNRMK